MQSLQTNLTLMSFLEIHLEASDVNAAEMQAYAQRQDRGKRGMRLIGRINLGGGQCSDDRGGGNRQKSSRESS